MRLDLVLLSALAATALGALIESTRRAALGCEDAREHDWSAGIVPRATIEELERAWARLDDAAARALIGLGIGSMTVGATTLAMGVVTIEVTAVLIAAGLGLALPGLSWAHDVRGRRRAVTERIATLRARIARVEGARELRITRSASSLPRSTHRRSAAPPPRS
ncbi:MAG: hypothetical protein M3Y87_14935 [Myxococcota bacterium]|nr:hypothetical protein [Myxococcota bacterium]